MADTAQGRRVWLRWAMTVTAVLVLVAPAAGQCPMCRTGLETPEAMALAAAFNRAILFLLVIPFVAVAAIGVGLVIAHRRRPKPVEPVRVTP